MGHVRSTWVLLAGAIACASPALADTPDKQTPPAASSASTPPAARGAGDEKEEAMQRFKRAVELYEEQDYRAALIEFRQAFKLAPSYKLLYNIGQSCYQIQDYVCALKSLEGYVNEGKQDIPAARKTQVDDDIARLRTRVGRVSVNANVIGASITIDDVPAGSTPLEEPIIANIGRRKIVVTKEGRAPVTQMVDVAGATVTNVDVNLMELKGSERTIIVREGTSSRMTLYSWIGVGAAGVLALSATFTGLKANSASKDLQDMRYAGPNPSPALEDQQSEVKSYALVTDILAGAAIVTLGTTLVWTFVRPTVSSSTEAEPPPKTTGLVLGPRGVAWKGEF